MKPLISIIMPTYNAERTIELALQSIRSQTIDQELIEILVIDGGSTDATLEIAKKYGARILHNEKRLPEPGISIGLQNANGKYITKNGSDEVFTSPDQLKKRIDLLSNYPEVKCILADQLIPPKGYDFACAYLNIIGDPFTFFVYNNKGTITENLKKYSCFENEGRFIYHFKEDDLLPIGDGGTTMIEMDYVREIFNDRIKEQVFASTIFDEVVRKTGYTACIMNDSILHYSAASLKIYFRKLKFRVINNIFDKTGSGYTARAISNMNLNRRKYLYPLYCISVILPIIDSVRLSIRFKDSSFLMHPVYAYYVLFEIVIQYTKKILGLKAVNKSYGS